MKKKKNTQREEAKQNVKEQWDNYKRGIITHTIEISEGAKGELFEVIMTEFSKINDRHQTIDPGNTENTKQNEYQKIYTEAYYI